MWIRSRRSSTDCLAFLLAAGLCLGSAAARGQDAPAGPDGDVREKARAVLGQGYQRDLPGAEGGEGEGLGNAYRPPPGLSSPPGDPGFRPRPAAVGEAFSQLIRLTLFALGIAALVLLGIWLLRDLPSRGVRARTRPGEAPPGSPDRPDAERGGPTLADAERLAAQERWTEAVHLLLLVAIRHLSARFSIPQVSSRTSREISRLLPLQKEARDAFSGLVRTVEISLFGGAAVGPDEYRTSLESVRFLLGRAS